ncbi:hypothetical protein EV182_001237 [Spiromyces aspiralis]|uniref:Uncharacterized protein n=1 Tax=Spiromyces aspiralis TaxID=68401 RepID=A0ACC1HW02_9FUNG|nr:hypothetical protein EV182_001237 [Spiromyces aspiralis]
MSTAPLDETLTDGPHAHPPSPPTHSDRCSEHHRPPTVTPPVLAPLPRWRRWLMGTKYTPEITITRSVFFLIWIAIHVVVLVKKVTDLAPNNLFKGFRKATITGLEVCLITNYICMSRAFLSLLRRTVLPRLGVSFEKNVHVHKVSVYTLFVWLVMHWVVYYKKYIDQYHSQREHSEKAKPFRTLTWLLAGQKHLWTGYVLVAIILTMTATSIAIVRRKRYELFYYVHQLHIPMTIILFFHGDNNTFYKYISGPLALYTVDRLYRLARGYLGHTRIAAVIQHPSDVYEIRIKKRMLPRMHAGQYLMLNCPSVAPLQWHPFTLTSAPEEDEISVHMKVVGDWTRAFAALLSGHTEPGGYKLSRRSSTATPSLEKQLSAEFDKLRTNTDTASSIYLPKHVNAASRPASLREAATGGGGVQVDVPKLTIEEYSLTKHDRSDNSSTTTKGLMAKLRACAASVREIEEGGTKYYRAAGQLCLLKIVPKVFVDGPYGAPAEHIFRYKTAVMIGAGIGVTPFASVLRSIRWRLHNCPDKLELRKIYFIWVCRDMRSFEWFKDLLISLERDGLGSLVEFRTYFTGQLPDPSKISPEDSAYYVPVSSPSDPFGPFKVKNTFGGETYFGRPKLEALIGTIGLRHPQSKVGVFFCGPKQMRSELRVITHRWSSQLGKSQGTKFEFHAEHF